jgi:hypothetical protein
MLHGTVLRLPHVLLSRSGVIESALVDRKVVQRLAHYGRCIDHQREFDMSLAPQHPPVSFCDINPLQLRSVRRAVRAVLAATALCAGLASPVSATTLGTVTVIGYAPSGGGAGGWGGGSNWTYAPEEPWIVVQGECNLVATNGVSLLSGCTTMSARHTVPNNSTNQYPATCQSDASSRQLHAGGDVKNWYSGQWPWPEIGSIVTVEYNDGAHEDYRLNAPPIGDPLVFLTMIADTLRDCPP